MGANQKLKIVGAVGVGVVIQMLASKHHGAELAKDGILLVGQCLVDDVVEIRRVVERQTADADLGKKVVLSRLAPTVVPVVVPVAVESAEVKVGRNGVVFLVATSTGHIAVQTTIGDEVHITTQHHHHDAVVLVFLYDIVADLVLVVHTRHGTVNVAHRGDAVAQPNGVVISAVFVKSIHILSGGDDQKVVCRHLAATGLVTLHHLRVLCHPANTVLDRRCAPQHGLMICFCSGETHADGGFGGIHHLTCGRNILHWGERGERKAISVLVLGG